MKTLYLFGSGASYDEDASLPTGKNTLNRILGLSQKNLDKHKGSFEPNIKKLRDFVASCKKEDENDFERLFDWIEEYDIGLRDKIMWIVWQKLPIGIKYKRVIAWPISNAFLFFDSINYRIEKMRGLRPRPPSARIPFTEYYNGKRSVNFQESQAIFIGLKCLLLTSEKCKIPLHKKFIKNIYKDGDVIATTNYDILLDRAIWDKFGKINYGTTMIKKSKSARFSISDDAPLLLKLHGSFNWSHNSFSDIPIFGSQKTDGGQKHQLYIPHVEAYDRFVENSQADVVSFVMPGTDKGLRISSNPLTFHIWRRFSQVLASCDRIVIIGNGVSNSIMKKNKKTNDSHLRELLELYKSKIVVIDSSNPFEKWVREQKPVSLAPQDSLPGRKRG